ncbi:hypothetical protein [uncultured Metabacillus sp.]|nr:hypothetical protein [uncultured Metabacillus sp.]
MTELINRYKNDQEFRYITLGTIGTAIIIVPLLYIGTLIGYLHT